MGLTRSEQMARIRARDTTPERLLAEALAAAGVEASRTKVLGRVNVDIAFPDERVLVFVDGCFWHGCPEHYSRPRTSADFWAAKLASNVARDREQTLRLAHEGWAVLRVWEHEIIADVESVVVRVLRALGGKDAAASPRWCVFKVEVLDAALDFERRWQCHLLDPAHQRHVDGPRMTGKQRPSRKRPAGASGQPP